MTDSGMHARAEALSDTLERVLSKLDRMDERQRDHELTVVRDIATLRGDVANVRALVDGLHARATTVDAEVVTLRERVSQLETKADQLADESKGHHRKAKRTMLASTSMAAGSGGLVAGVIEVIKAVLQ